MIEFVLVQHRRSAPLRLAGRLRLWLGGALLRNRVYRGACVPTAATKQLLNTL